MARTVKNVRPVEDVAALGRKVWLASLGAFAMAGEETASMFRELVEKGRKAEPKRVTGTINLEKAGERVQAEIGKVGRQVEQVVQERAAAALHRFGVPTREEIQQLIRRVEQLNAKLEHMNAPHKVN